jgi:C1A family cysteine protease
MTQKNRLYPVVKDTIDARDHLVAPVIDPNSLPKYNRLNVMDQIPVKNQGQEGSCTAHAGATLREFLHRTFFNTNDSAEYKTKYPIDVKLSPQFQYWCERTIEGDIGIDNGAQSRTIFQSLMEYGICPETDELYSDTAWKLKPSDQSFADAQALKIGAYHRIPDVQTAKSVIASGYPFTAGIRVYTNFESAEAARTGLITIPSQTDYLLGGHEVLAYGYSDAMIFPGTNEVGGFLFRNSWGPDWGINGDFWMSYECLTLFGEDFWTAHLGKAWK